MMVELEHNLQWSYLMGKVFWTQNLIDCNAQAAREAFIFIIQHRLFFLFVNYFGQKLTV
jgi:hypothetical protein